MTDPNWYVLPINPEPWKVGPVGVNRKGGRIGAYVGRDQQLHAFQEALREAIEPLYPEMMEGLISLTLYVWRRRDSYLSPQARTHRKHEADATNMQKAIEDAFQGILYGNDKDNRHVQTFVMEQSETATGCIVVKIEPYVEPELPEQIWEEVEKFKDWQPFMMPKSMDPWNGPDGNEVTF